MTFYLRLWICCFLRYHKLLLHHLSNAQCLQLGLYHPCSWNALFDSSLARYTVVILDRWRGKKSDGYMRILTEKKLSLDTQTNIGHQKTGSWVKGHSLGYSIKIKKNSRKKLKKTFHTPFYVGIWFQRVNLISSMWL